MKIVWFLILFLLLWFILRYIAYQHVIQWKLPKIKVPIEKYERMYEEALKGPTELFADYENLDIEAFQQGYCTYLLRKYPWSNANDLHVELAEIQEGIHVLDLGCGTGVQAIHLCKQIPNVTIDCIVNSTKCYQTTLENIKKADLTDRIRVYWMDFDHLKEPILSKRYDRICMFQSVGYSTNRRNLFKNLRELLKPEGKLFISTLTVSSDADEEINKVIKIWKYNFSTLDNILSDLNGYRHIQTISYHQTWYTVLFLNLLDILRLIRFNRSNPIFPVSILFYFTPPMTNQFLLITR